MIPSSSLPAAAVLAAGVLLSCALAPAHAGQPSPGHPSYRCTVDGQQVLSGTPCGQARQRADAARRPRLDADTLRECRSLRTAIVESEGAERRPRAAVIESVQQDLSILRKRYKKLGCQESTGNDPA